EHVTAVSVSVKDKLTLSLGVAVGSSIVCRTLIVSMLDSFFSANRALCHSLHRGPRLDPRQAADHALRPVR
ncbi:unnamed protein product, partial [Mycena citricolor]